MKRFLEKIDEWISTHIKLDDTLHYICCAIITAILYILVLNYFDYEVDFNLVSAIAFFCTVIVAATKEIVIDFHIKKSTFSTRDMIAGILGSLTTVVFMTIFKSMNIFVDMYVRETIMNNFLN